MTKRIFLTLVSIVAFSFLSISCESTTAAGDDPYNGDVRTQTNMHADSAEGWLYFSLDDDKIIPADQIGTDNWDIKMAYLLCCGGTRQINVFLNSGSVGVGSTKGAVVNSRFETLTEVPAELTLREDETSIEDRIVPASVLGADIMFIYEGPPNHTIAVSPDKILVISTASGNTYKFQFTSIYKDHEQSPTQETPMGYYHFRYQQALNGAW